jgi:flagellar hook-associated protein 3 FlgL
MRVTDEMSYRMISGNLSSGQKGIYNLQRQISSGKAITRPSDDPGMYEIIQRLRADLANDTQYERNIEQAGRELLSTEDSMRNCIAILQRANELAIRASDATSSVSDRQTMGTEVNQLLESLIGIANFSEGGRYRFAGMRSDTKPFTTADANGDGLIDSVSYNGSLEIKQIEASKGIFIPVSFPGSNTGGQNAVFQTQTADLFNTLIDLRDRMLAGENLAESRIATADAGTDALTVSGSYTTGARIRISSTGTLPGGLSADTDYYVISAAPGSIQLAATLADARAGTPVIDLTSAGTGTISVESLTAGTITDDIDHVLTLVSTVGARQESLSLYSDILIAHKANIIRTLDDTESLDIAQAMMDLSQQQAAYQAALSASSLFLNQRTLIDFIM